MRTKDKPVPKSRFKKFQGKKVGKGGFNTSNADTIKIFERVVKNQTDGQDTSATGSQELSPAILEYYNNLSRLRPMMKVESLDRCLDFFLTEIWPKAPFQDRNRLLQQRGTYLMSRIAEAKATDMDNPTLPSVARITQLFNSLDALSTSKWSNLMMHLIKSIIDRSGEREDYPSDEVYETAVARKVELLDDLAESWILFQRYRLNRDTSKVQNSQETEFRLPEINEARLRYYTKYGDLVGALGLIFPDFIVQHKQVPSVALATFVLLVDPTHTHVSARQKLQPLLTRIGRILTIVTVRQPALAKMLEPYPDILWYVLKLWQPIISGLRKATDGGKRGFLIASGILSGKLGESAIIDTKAIQQRLTGALGMGDIAAVETEWVQYWGKNNTPDDEGRIESMKKHQGLFNYFILAFTALRHIQRAVDVWDAMERIGIKPDRETWTSMIEGCRRSKNAAGLENIWRKLMASGIPLDHKVWPTRIAGLMDCGEPEAALRALKEMARLSKAPDAIPLTIEPVNAAVVGLIRLNSMSAAKEVLSWASDNGVEPDVFTYNLLLRPLVQDANSVQIKNLLESMCKQGVQPDGATFTVLLEGLMSSTQDTSPDEQFNAVKRLLQEIDDSGVKANMETFARMMHLVIRDGRNNTGHHTEGAVGAIYRHILQKSLRPSQHIYTMLVDYYFSQRPPAVAKVDELLVDGNGILLEAHRRLDRVFWERVIRGYAAAGKTDKAFDLFENIGNLGSALTLDCLDVLLRALVRAGQIKKAEKVVETVRLHRTRSRGHMPGGPESRFWRHRFWAFAHDCGILSLEEWKQLAATPPPGAPATEVNLPVGEV